MLKYFSKKKLILLCGDMLLIIASFYLSSFIRWSEFGDIRSSFNIAVILSLFIYIFIFYIADFYNLEDKFKSKWSILRFAAAVVVANSIIAIVFYIFPFWKYGRGIFLLSGVFIFILSILWHLIFNEFFKHQRVPSGILIVGAGEAGNAICNILKENNDINIIGLLDDDPYKLGMSVGSSKVIGKTEMLLSLLNDRKIDRVIVAITHDMSPELFKQIVQAKFNGVEIYDMLSVYQSITGKIPVLHTNDRWLWDADIYGIKKNLYNTKIKTVLDKFFAVTGTILSSPVMLITAILIKLDSIGPVFYSQQRVGKDGKIFTLFKFRSMRADAEPEGAVWAEKNDYRVTSIGRVIRFLRIDEIPQMWNVLKGDMSFIGPRPERPEFVEHLSKEIPYYSLRNSVKPGITGWAQVNYRYGASKEDSLEKLQYDLFYIKNVSFLLDIVILFVTIRVVLFGRGAR